jgi:hypothetical protein
MDVSGHLHVLAIFSVHIFSLALSFSKGAGIATGYRLDD